MAARNVLTGGVHYRDLFDTNTPGFVWLLAGIRSTVGWSSESLLTVDLFIAAGIALILDQLAKLAGASGRNRLWLAAGCVGFYVFSHEMAHAQRDVWLTLPAMLAVWSRLARITRPAGGNFRGVFLPAAAEGVLWAIAVWIKPHFLLVAGCWWLLTAPRLAGVRTAGKRWSAWLGVLIADLGGSLLSGGVVGALGVWYLVSSGTWAAFTEVMTVWNVGYLETTLDGINLRWAIFVWFPPWNFLAPLAVGYALFGILDARLWAGRFRPPEQGGFLRPISFRAIWHKEGTDEQRYARGALGAVYLLWLLQGIVLQRPYLYIHAAEVMIGLAVWAAYRWNATALIVVWLLLVQSFWVFAPDATRTWATESHTVREAMTPHPAFDRQRSAHWADCFRQLPERERYRLQDDLRREIVHPASIGWEELNDVAVFLRSQHVGDRELVCWHDSPHPLYLMLNIKPGIRFMHVNTARIISDDCDRRVCAEFDANTEKRFVVIDLQRFAFVYWLMVRSQLGQKDHSWVFQAYNQPGPTKDDLLPPIAGWLREDPWWLSYEPPLPFPVTRTVFRSGNGRGRYVVIALKE